MQRILVAGVVVALCSSSLVAAQVAPETTPAAAADDDDPGSPAIALGLSLGVPTVAMLASSKLFQPDSTAGFVALTGALAVGPATGWLYAGRPRRALATSAIRVVAGGILLIGVQADDGGPSEEVVTVAALAVLGSVLYDIVGAPAAVSGDRTRWREQREAKAAARRAMLVPTAHEHGGGLALVGRF